MDLSFSKEEVAFRDEVRPSQGPRAAFDAAEDCRRAVISISRR